MPLGKFVILIKPHFKQTEKSKKNRRALGNLGCNINKWNKLFSIAITNSLIKDILDYYHKKRGRLLPLKKTGGEGALQR